MGNELPSQEHLLDLHATLVAAIDRGDIQGIRDAVAAGIPVDGIESKRMLLSTPLCRAARRLQAGSFAALLELGANPTAGSTDFSNIIWHATQSPFVEKATLAAMRTIVRAAAAMGVAVDAINREGDTPLLKLVRQGRDFDDNPDAMAILREQVAVLIECGANPRRKGARSGDAYDLARQMTRSGKELMTFMDAAHARSTMLQVVLAAEAASTQAAGVAHGR